MQHRVSLGGHISASLWTTLLAGALMVLACSWVTLTSISAQAADPNNILLDFSAKWCGPCQQMSPIVSKLERQGFPIRQVDVDQEKSLAQKYNVESIPCFVLIANGREINRITGATDEKQLRRLMMTLPKQNIDEALVGKSPEKKRSSASESQASTRAPEEKKGFLSIPPLFKKKEPKQQPEDEVETILGQTPEGPPNANDLASNALMASTRIRVKDGSQEHFGSGTVIDCQQGRAIILTCGHILRNLGKSAVIKVDLFSEGTSNPQVATAEILEYDLDADVGLLAIPCRQKLPTVKLALSRDLPREKDNVFSIGCGGGKLPSIEKHMVTAINSFAGPDNLECTGVPLQGRSGGGLFLGAEQVGVCILADANYKRGIYTGMKPVAQLLRKAELGHLVPSSISNDRTTENLSAAAEHSLSDPALTTTSGTVSVEDDSVARMIEMVSRDGTGSAGSPSLAARDYAGAEIVCIIRPKTQGGLSRVVIINQASSRILDDLLHESSGGGRSDTK